MRAGDGDSGVRADGAVADGLVSARSPDAASAGEETWAAGTGSRSGSDGRDGPGTGTEGRAGAGIGFGGAGLGRAGGAVWPSEPGSPFAAPSSDRPTTADWTFSDSLTAAAFAGLASEGSAESEASCPGRAGVPAGVFTPSRVGGCPSARETAGSATFPSAREAAGSVGCSAERETAGLAGFSSARMVTGFGGVVAFRPTRAESARVRPVAAQPVVDGPLKRAFRGGFEAGREGFAAGTDPAASAGTDPAVFSAVSPAPAATF